MPRSWSRGVRARFLECRFPAQLSAISAPGRVTPRSSPLAVLSPGVDSVALALPCVALLASLLGLAVCVSLRSSAQQKDLVEVGPRGVLCSRGTSLSPTGWFDFTTSALAGGGKHSGPCGGKGRNCSATPGDGTGTTAGKHRVAASSVASGSRNRVLERWEAAFAEGWRLSLKGRNSGLQLQHPQVGLGT